MRNMLNTNYEEHARQWEKGEWEEGEQKGSPVY